MAYKRGEDERKTSSRVKGDSKSKGIKKEFNTSMKIIFHTNSLSNAKTTIRKD